MLWRRFTQRSSLLGMFVRVDQIHLASPLMTLTARKARTVPPTEMPMGSRTHAAAQLTISGSMSRPYLSGQTFMQYLVGSTDWRRLDVSSPQTLCAY